MSRLNELKKEHMQKFCEATRQELHTVWDQCMFGPQQRQEFSAAFSGEHVSHMHILLTLPGESLSNCRERS